MATLWGPNDHWESICLWWMQLASIALAGTARPNRDFRLYRNRPLALTSDSRGVICRGPE